MALNRVDGALLAQMSEQALIDIMDGHRAAIRDIESELKRRGDAEDAAVARMSASECDQFVAAGDGQ